MATSLADLISRLRAAALDRPHYDTLSGPSTLNNTDLTTAVTFSDGSSVGIGGIVDFDDATFEAAYMRDKPTGATGTIVRGWESVTAAHVQGCRLRLNPRYRAFQYRQALNAALGAIGAAFGRDVWDTTQTFSSSVRLIPVPATAKRVVEVASNPSSPVLTTQLQRIPFDWMPSAPVALASTGNAVRLIGKNPGSGTVYIHYQDAWPLLVNSTDMLDPDYPPDAEDLITYGAEAWLLDSDTFALVAYQEPHVKQRQFGSAINDVRAEFATAMQHFIQRRSEVAATRPGRSPSWLRGY